VVSPEDENRIGLSAPRGIAPADNDLGIERPLTIGTGPQAIPLDGGLDLGLELLNAVGRVRRLWFLPTRAAQRSQQQCDDPYRDPEATFHFDTRCTLPEKRDASNIRHCVWKL
jgi:hypothetical protein